MGYESRIIVGEKTKFRNDIQNMVFFEKLFEVNLCCMGNEEVNGRRFPEIFRTEINFDLVVDRDFTREDDYGAHCKYTDLDTVIEWLKSSKRTGHEYRRGKMLLEMLEGFKRCEKDYKQICVVHYGY